VADTIVANEGNVPIASEEFTTDLTEYERAQRELFEANQRVAAHLDNSPLAVVEFDPAFRIVRWSNAAERLFGWTADELLGRPITELR
jgi:PAS domain-containing protein